MEKENKENVTMKVTKKTLNTIRIVSVLKNMKITDCLEDIVYNAALELLNSPTNENTEISENLSILNELIGRK